MSDLAAPLPTTPAPARSRAGGRTGFAGLSIPQLAMAGAVIALATWAMWVTRQVLVRPPDRIVSIRLSAIVGDYVKDEVRSAAPPGQVARDMRTFMAALDRELQRRAADGDVVLVGEAVLSRNVPDITDSVMRAVGRMGLVRQPPAIDPGSPSVSAPASRAGLSRQSGGASPARETGADRAPPQRLESDVDVPR